MAVSGRGGGFRALRGLGQARFDLFGLRCGLLGLLGLQLGGRDGGGGHLGPAGGERAAQKDQECVHAEGYSLQIEAVLDGDEREAVLNAVRTMPVIAK